MIKIKTVAKVAVVLFFVGFSIPSASAQTGPDIVVLPWDTHQAVDTSTDAVLGTALPTRENHDQDVRLSSYQSAGRWRILPDNRATPTIGYDALYYDIETDDPALPRHLFNGSVGFAQPVAEINKYFVILTASGGYAGESPFNDQHAVYFTGNVIVGRIFSKDRAFVAALNYDGNRNFFPGVPIPGFAFRDRYNDHLTYTVGLPINSITYEPLDGLQINAGWSLLSTFDAKVGYQFLDHFTLYGNYTDRLTGFHLKELDPDRRLFFQEHRIETGFRYAPTKLIRLSVGGGWSFGQEFARGYDTTGLNPVRHLRDGPFLRMMLEIGF